MTWRFVADNSQFLDYEQSQRIFAFNQENNIKPSIFKPAPLPLPHPDSLDSLGDDKENSDNGKAIQPALPGVACVAIALNTMIYSAGRIYIDRFDNLPNIITDIQFQTSEIISKGFLYDVYLVSK